MSLVLPIPTELPHTVHPSYEPKNASDFLRCMNSWRWRMFSGQVYKIMVKGDDKNAGPGMVMPFIPNGPQTNFLDNLHYRNVILKARQLGFTTVIDIYLLDYAMYHENVRCGIIAHSKTDVQTIFRDKVRFAYENMPELAKIGVPLKTQNTTEYLFAHNNSSIRVAMSMRSGTIHRLHISEMGKMAAKFPAKAEEIVTGSLPAVPKNGIAFIESTAEGQSGEFYNICQKAEANHQAKKKLSRAEWKFFFYPWWSNPLYAMNPKNVVISEEDHAYLDMIEVEMDTLLTNRQRAWYVSTRDTQFSGDQAKMWREHPSKPSECWQQSTEGKYYPKQLIAARTQGRICKLEYIPGVPVHTFWDIGSGDGTGIWLMQHIQGQFRFLKYIEGWVEGYSHYIERLQATGWVFGRHYVPHDAEHQRQQEYKVAAPIDMLKEVAPQYEYVTVPRVQAVQHRIDAMRKHFPLAWFDEEGCKEGLIHLANYQKSYSTITGCYTDTPLKNDATEAADSLGQWAQVMEANEFGAPTRPRSSRSRAGGMAA